ncbi:pyruvate kinase [Candidatus Saccharibacteria bacterium]|nr:pyruvate kinase [Candidatus Saccharibacteria bacterium]
MSKLLFKRTKILATVGPSVFAEEKLHELVQSGVNGFRFNFSHGTYEEREAQMATIRKYAEERGKSVAILQDLQGPKIRLGELRDNHKDVHVGDELILDHAATEHDGGNVLPVQYNLAEKVKVGEPIYIFDGKIRTSVIEITSSTAIKVRVENDGYIMSRKGINLPDTDLGGDIITEKDMEDIKFGAAHDFDYVALSFIQSAEDIRKLRQILRDLGSTARIIAKIETKKAIESEEAMTEIVQEADGIMIARGDMAIEAGAEVVPVVQRRLIALCRKYSKLSIVATQMMASMVENPEPTRAEVNDVATGVLLGADAVMLSDETANGKYPIETVLAMKKVILYAQEHAEMQPAEEDPTGSNHGYEAIARAAVQLAEDINADLILVGTKSGATSMAIAAQRPKLPMISVTSNARVAGQLALIYANSAFVRPYDTDYVFNLAQELKRRDYLKLGEDNKADLTAVVVYGLHNSEGSTSSIQIRKF